MYKEVISYLNGVLSINYYIGDKTLPYRVAFIFMTFLYVMFYWLVWLLLFITCPIWICPYLIFRKYKEEK